jgi:hypothetical protein
VAPKSRRDASRTRSEARLAFRTPLVGGEDGLDDRRYSVLDVTSGLPDDSRDSDERVRAQRLREQRGRVAAAKAVIQAHPGLADVLARDQTKLVRFCAVHHVTPQELCPFAENNWARISAPGTARDGMCGYCHGWHAWQAIHVEDVQEVLASPYDCYVPSVSRVELPPNEE